MDLLRQLRKNITLGSLWVGTEISQRTDDPAIVEGIRAVLLGLARTLVPLRRRLARNMKSAGEGHLVSPPPGGSKAQRLK